MYNIVWCFWLFDLVKHEIHEFHRLQPFSLIYLVLQIMNCHKWLWSCAWARRFWKSICRRRLRCFIGSWWRARHKSEGYYIKGRRGGRPRHTYANLWLVISSSYITQKVLERWTGKSLSCVSVYTSILVRIIFQETFFYANNV